MEKSSYLHMSKNKRIYVSRRKMETKFSSDSYMSTDSLEGSRHKSPISKQNNSDENVDTILVPFYENDVLIKVPKTKKKCKKNDAKNEKSKKEVAPNYLINKNKKKSSSYLEMFRKQFASPTRNSERVPPDEYEISSMQPEVGDTARDSIDEDTNGQLEEFFNTECYNEMFYENILNQGEVDYLDNSIEPGLEFTEDLENKTGQDDNEDNNLRSVSEVAQHRHQSRYSAAHPIPNVKLGGLGPDMELIKPRLERARSLQRYSEKVRMENRLRIYKKSVEAEKISSREQSAKRHGSAKEPKNGTELQSHSYLVKKAQEQKTNIVTRVYQSKSKSANVRGREEAKEKEKQLSKETLAEPKKRENDEPKEKTRQKVRSRRSYDKNVEKEQKVKETVHRVKSSAISKGINTDNSGKGVPPVQISFLVNVGGLRPSSALKTLEEKHRMYQEQVKGFTFDNN